MKFKDLKGIKLKSLQLFFGIAICLLITTISVPLFFSGTLLMESIILDFGEKLLNANLHQLLEHVDRRYKTLERIGLEDSLAHQREIKEISLKEFSKFNFGESGGVFVIEDNGSITLPGPLKSIGPNEFQILFKQLQHNKKGFIEYHAGRTNFCSVFTYYPKWKSYIGISIKRAELFKSKYKYIFINTLTLMMALCIAFLFILKIEETILRPILSMAKYADEVSKGNYSYKLSGTFKYELQRLKDNFIRMVCKLKDKIEESQTQLKIIQDREIQLKSALNALEREKERLAITLKSIGDGVITTDIIGRIDIMNDVAERLTGWQWKDAYGMPLKDVFNIVNEKTGEPVVDPVSKVIDRGKVVSLTNHTVLISKDGTKRLISASAAPIKDHEGSIIGVALVFRDITEKRRIEEEFLKIEKLKSVGVLAGGIAHDFNNILTAILGNISLLGLSEDLDERKRKIIEQAEKACLRARDLTQQLLTFAKGGSPVKKTLRLHEVVKESAEFSLRGSGVALDFEANEDLWLTDVDPGQFSQVIQNIVINAKEAMNNSGRIRIILENIASYAPTGSVKPKDWVSISIEDTGPGIPEDIKNQIFEPYFTTKDQGSGLGLAICHSIVSKHDGFIEVESRDGKGTIFRILLPKSFEETASPGTREEKELARIKRGKILLVDDDEMIRYVAKDMIEYLGHHVEVAETCEEAINKYKISLEQDSLFDCVIIDLTLPGEIGGLKIKDEILKLNSNAKLIVSSGYASNPIMSQHKKYGFFAVLTKPYRLTDLDNVIRAAIS
ncbi:PAS sensor protein [Dissulfuribacter thermophilus]|uniref:histidine kinase n=1 Tax=Dissulfuribacter thermophilus TaxID=1156395 RepID=A0A1B9F818_9BACT|nr:ATP-binding protein [Dissulfuribacter thermophilus]OCC16056.1 PAS sensor protein [Dissulfuribacter thermophilus]